MEILEYKYLEIVITLKVSFQTHKICKLLYLQESCVVLLVCFRLLILIKCMINVIKALKKIISCTFLTCISLKVHFTLYLNGFQNSIGLFLPVFILSCLHSSSFILVSLDPLSLSFSHATIHLCDSWAWVGARGPVGSWPLHLCNFSSGSHDEDSSETPEEPTVQAAGQPPSLPAQHDPEVCGKS